MDRPTPLNEYVDEAAVSERVAAGKHREVIGGMWDEIGALQRDFLVRQGLRPGDRLIDIGCGSLRAGVQLVPLLEPGHYFGIDISRSLIDAGYENEIVPAGLADRLPRSNLALTETFDLSSFGTSFDVGIAQSVFSHVPRSTLVDCLTAIHPWFRPGGVLYSTWFVAPHPSADHSPYRQAEGPVTFHDRDYFHSSREEILETARGVDGWSPVWIGDWNHPRGQRMLATVRV